MPKALRVTIWIVATILVVCGGGGSGALYFGCGPLDIGPAAREADEAAIAYRKAGLPWEAKDLQPNPPVAPNDNAAPILRQAIALYESKKLARKVRPLFDALKAGDTKALDGGLQQFGPALKLAAPAADKPGVDFQRDWDLGPDLVFAEYKGLKDFTKVFAIRAERRAAIGDVDGCFEDLIHAWRLGLLAGKEPTQISMLVDIACKSITLDRVRRCATLFRNRADALGRLDALFDQFKGEPNLAFSLRGNMYEGLAAIRNLPQYGRAKETGQSDDDSGGSLPKLDPSKLVRTGLPRDPLSRAFAARHVQVWLEAKQRLDEHSEDPEAQSKALDQIIDRISTPFRASYTFEETMLSLFSQSGVAIVRHTADKRATQALVRALIVEAKTGALPKRIEDIPGNWTDPFTKKPLRLVSVNGSIRIYSVGHDRRDDGGLTRSELKKKGIEHSDDVIAACPPPP